MDGEIKVQAWWKGGSRMGKGIKTQATDVTRSFQGRWLGSLVLDCSNLIRTVNPAFMGTQVQHAFTIRMKRDGGGKLCCGQGSTQTDRWASCYFQAHARPDSITIYSSLPCKAQSNSLEKYMSRGNKEGAEVIAETSFNNLCYWADDGPFFKSSCAWYNMSLEHPI